MAQNSSHRIPDTNPTADARMASDTGSQARTPAIVRAFSNFSSCRLPAVGLESWPNGRFSIPWPAGINTEPSLTTFDKTSAFWFPIRCIIPLGAKIGTLCLCQYAKSLSDSQLAPKKNGNTGGIEIMKLKELRVFRLFDHFDHIINVNNEEKITIITAPNGYGKTIILKIIDAIFNANYRFLVALDFSTVEAKFDNSILAISRHGEKGSFTLEFQIAGNQDKYFRYDPSETREKGDEIPLGEIDRFVPWLDRVGAREWADETTGRILDLDDVLQLYSDEIPFHISVHQKSLPEWLSELTEAVNIHLIQDQRLILRSGFHRTRHRKARVIDTIEKYADELAVEIKRKSVGSSEISQKLDSSFPSRLLQKSKSFETLSISELKKRLSELKDIREKLSAHSLIASADYSQFVDLDEIKEDDTKVLTLYVNDAKEKLAIYSDISQRIDLFTEILNEKRLSFKKVKIDRERGFVFVTDKGKPLQLTQLSSGEQHEVVLLYELIFRAKDNVLVLIDEPEISLHIAWQKEFLRDLKRIISLQNVAAIISTHSPQIIDNNWHLVVDLESGATK